MASHLRARIRAVSGWSVLAAACIGMSFGPSATAARASVIITAPTISLPYSATARTGTLEVYVQDASDPSPPQVGADNVELALPDESSVVFTGASATTNPYPYLFGSQQPGVAVTSGGDVVIGSDFASSTLPTLADGEGLLLVDYTIQGGASGDFPLTFDVYGTSNPIGTALFNGANAQIATLFQSGSINIAPSGSPLSVPEPSSVVLAMLAVIGTGMLVYRHNHAKGRVVL